MDHQGKIECVLDQEITVSKDGLQTTYSSACVVMENGATISLPNDAARQIRQWVEGSTVRIAGIGEPLMQIEWVG